LRLFGKDEPR